MTTESFGKAVDNGQVRYLSVSALEKFDPRGAAGCNRKWYFRYVERRPEPTSASMQSGINLHAEIENYLKTGEKALSQLALRGLHILPQPGKDLWVEQPIHVMHNGIITSKLTAAGIPFVGKIDILHRRGTNQGTDDVEDAFDPPGTVEVADIKWKGNAAWHGQSSFKRPDELIKTIQMSGYGEWVRRSFQTAQHVRLSHLYFPVKGGVPTKVTRLHVVDDCAKAWEYAEGLARSVIDVAKETSVDAVPANVHACSAYGGCPHAAYCDKGKQKHGMQHGGNDMGWLDTLKDEEARLKAEVAQQQKVMVDVPLVAEVWKKIKSYGRGYPALKGNAAEAVYGPSSRGIFIGGSGQLEVLVLDEVEHIYALADELAEAVANTPPPEAEPPLQAILPPDAPTYDKATASAGPDGMAKKRGRKPKAVTVSEPVVETSAIAAEVPPTPTPATPDAPKAATGSTFSNDTDAVVAHEVCVFVDCIPNVEYRSLHDYLDIVLSALTERYCTNGIKDVRCAPNDSAISFGKWRGALAAWIRENPPSSGTYVLDTRGNEIAEVAADALRACASLYVRGVR